MKPKLLSLLLIIYTSNNLYSQSNITVSGKVINIENNEPLPFATISLKNSHIGTTSNDAGEFDFHISTTHQKDTLQISYIGFYTFEITVKNALGGISVPLQPFDNLLDEVFVNRLEPIDYIKKALENLDQNYPQNNYQSIAFYREKFIENNIVIDKKEAVFKTYYTARKDSTKNQHQTLLYKKADNPQKFQFMREWFEKKQTKRKNKAIKKGEQFDEDKYSTDMDIDFGGPETILEIDINSKRDPYLTPQYFKKYEYTYGKETVLNNETLITIHFKAKRQIDYIKDEGTILINKENYAIISIEATGKLSVPLFIKPILFAMGLKIEKPQFTKTVRYQKYKDLWYPKLFRWDANVVLTKKHIFSPNENSNIQIGQVLLINKIDAIAKIIPKNKRFDTKKNIENQVYNDFNISWKDMNIIKD